MKMPDINKKKKFKDEHSEFWKEGFKKYAALIDRDNFDKFITLIENLSLHSGGDTKAFTAIPIVWIETPQQSIRRAVVCQVKLTPFIT